MTSMTIVTRRRWPRPGAGRHCPSRARVRADPIMIRAILSRQTATIERVSSCMKYRREELIMLTACVGRTDGIRDPLDSLGRNTTMTGGSAPVSQCQKPTGWLGRFILWRMNASHSKLTDWGLRHISRTKQDVILDVGCGGGETIRTLAASSMPAKVYGVDHSEESVAASCRKNVGAIEAGRVEIKLGSVSRLPFADGIFDLVTAVETHIWWPDLPGDMREIRRVLKPGGRLIIIAEVYKGANTMTSRLAEQYAGRTGMVLLTADEHRRLFTDAGYVEVQLVEEDRKGWICGMGRKPSMATGSVPDLGR